MAYDLINMAQVQFQGKALRAHLAAGYAVQVCDLDFHMDEDRAIAVCAMASVSPFAQASSCRTMFLFWHVSN